MPYSDPGEAYMNHAGNVYGTGSREPKEDPNEPTFQKITIRFVDGDYAYLESDRKMPTGWSITPRGAAVPMWAIGKKFSIIANRWDEANQKTFAILKAVEEDEPGVQYL